MTEEQIKFMINMGKALDEFRKEISDFKIRFDEHLSTTAMIDPKPILVNNPNSENKILVDFENNLGDINTQVAVSKSLLTAIIKMCDIMGIKKVEVVYKKSEK